MRFKLKLEVCPQVMGCELPFNYQYELSAAIYRILSQSDSTYSLWLHENGFIADNKRFKLFTFSNLIVPFYGIDKQRQRLIIKSDTIDWYITFLPEKSTKQFIEGVFCQQNFQIADRISGVEFLIREIQVMPPIEYHNEMFFKTLSPICISRRREDGKFDYLSPSDPNYTKGILTGLRSRYKAYYDKEYPDKAYCDFQVLGEAKSALVKIKTDTPQQTFVRGYRYEFGIKLPEELMRIMYESGLGEKGSLGWGMCEVLDKK